MYRELPIYDIENQINDTRKQITEFIKENWDTDKMKADKAMQKIIRDEEETKKEDEYIILYFMRCAKQQKIALLKYNLGIDIYEDYFHFNGEFQTEDYDYEKTGGALFFKARIECSPKIHYNAIQHTLDYLLKTERIDKRKFDKINSDIVDLKRIRAQILDCISTASDGSVEKSIEMMKDQSKNMIQQINDGGFIELELINNLIYLILGELFYENLSEVSKGITFGTNIIYSKPNEDGLSVQTGEILASIKLENFQKDF